MAFTDDASEHLDKLGMRSRGFGDHGSTTTAELVVSGEAQGATLGAEPRVRRCTHPFGYPALVARQHVLKAAQGTQHLLMVRFQPGTKTLHQLRLSLSRSIWPWRALQAQFRCRGTYHSKAPLKHVERQCAHLIISPAATTESGKRQLSCALLFDLDRQGKHNSLQKRGTQNAYFVGPLFRWQHHGGWVQWPQDNRNRNGVSSIIIFHDGITLPGLLSLLSARGNQHWSGMSGFVHSLAGIGGARGNQHCGRVSSQ